MNETFKQIFENELRVHNLKWCRGECGLKSNHKRGFVLVKDRTTVHLCSEIATRKTLHRALHEIGHCINDEKGLRSFECEALAEEFATKRMRELGITVPRETIKRGQDYVRRKKRHGDNIIKGRK